MDFERTKCNGRCIGLQSILDRVQVFHNRHYNYRGLGYNMETFVFLTNPDVNNIQDMVQFRLTCLRKTKSKQLAVNYINIEMGEKFCVVRLVQGYDTSFGWRWSGVRFPKRTVFFLPTITKSDMKKQNTLWFSLHRCRRQKLMVPVSPLRPLQLRCRFRQIFFNPHILLLIPILDTCTCTTCTLKKITYMYMQIYRYNTYSWVQYKGI